MAETPIGPGTLLARRFVLQDLLEESAGARFYRARDKVLARDVAVHVVVEDDPRSEALLSAARTSATVSDPHLLRVLDAATEDGVTYVVNEWGTGISLDRMLLEGPLSPRRAAWVAKEAAEGIMAAHALGVAHGRLIPENVVITDSGSVKLIGFVIDAVLRGREQETVDGTVLAEHESDVVNLGALLYAGLVAKWPGIAASQVPPAPTEHGRVLRPRQVRAGVPRPLDAICERVLGRGGQAHATPIVTAHEVYAALSDYIGDPAAAAPTPLAHGPDRAGSAEDAPDDRAEAADPEATQAGSPVFDPAGTAVARGPAATGEEQDPAGAPADPEATQLAPPLSPRREPPPPPPQLPEPEERPLFADTPRRTPPAEQPARTTARPQSPIPASWGPDADEPPAADTGELAEPAWPARPGHRSLSLAATLGGVLVLVVAVIFAFNLGRGSGTDPGGEAGEGSSASETAEPQPVRIAAVSDFDPGGDPPEENPESAPLAVDGDPQTAWRTSTYFDPINLLKEGVGLRVDLGQPTEVSEVDLTLVGGPTSVEVLAAGDGAAAPTSTDGLTQVATQPDAGNRTVLRLDEPTTTRYLVVWLTSLPQVEGGFQGQVAEIVVRS